MIGAKPFLTIGTRGSALALVQAGLVRRLLAAAHGVPEAAINIAPIITSGDKMPDAPLSLAGGKGLFSKEIEAALLSGAVDIGVHSAKDMATRLPDGLIMPVFLAREDSRDALVSLTAATLSELPIGATFGTSSIRRGAQLLRVRPDLNIVPFRGNVETRLKKLEAGIADATILAVAGLNRLGRQARITEILSPEQFPPAPAQGAIGIQYRTGDNRIAALVAPLNHLPTAIAVTAERALLARLDGSCRTPIGVLTRLEGETLTLFGQILSPDGRICHEASLSGDSAAALRLGAALGDKLKDLGGSDFFKAFLA